MKRIPPHPPWTPKFHTPALGRLNALRGQWKGLVWPQGVPKAPKEIVVQFKFDTSKKKIITGEMWFKSWAKGRNRVENYLMGGFEDETRLRFEYTKKLDKIIGGGTLHFYMSHDGEIMHGQIAGLSSHTGEYFYSEAILRKGKNADLSDYSSSKRKPTIFIGHGQSSVWKTVKQYLQKSGYRVQTFESGAHAGRHISEVLAGIVADTSFALLILTGEDKTESGKKRARQNVVYEAGFSHGKLGLNRAIMLLEKGVEEFSNVSGIKHIPFRKHRISETFKEIIATLKREFPKV